MFFLRCSSCDAAASVTPAPTTHPVEPWCTSRGRKSSAISVSISNCLRLSFGKRSVPPATNIAVGPRSADMRAASRAVFGRRYLNRGRRSTVQFLARWFHLDRRRVGDGRESRRSETRRFAFCFSTQGHDDLLRRNRNLIDPHAQCVVDRAAHCWRDRQQWSLSGFLGAVWTLWVDRLDDERLHVGHVEKRR